MIQLPETTYYGKRMPKEKFYSHLEVSVAVKRSFVDYVDYVVAQQTVDIYTQREGRR